MSRFIAYLCSDDSLTRLAMAQVAPELSFPEMEDTTGFGLGWIQDNRSLLRTNPRPTGGNGPAFPDLLSDIPARSILGYLREEQGPAPNTADMQPFRFRKWVFAHAGETPGLEEARSELLERVPDFLKGNIKGTTVSEVLFHRFLGSLHAHGVLDRERENPAACAEALAEMMKEVQVEAALGEAYCVGVSARILVVGRSGDRPVYYKLIEGIEEHREKPLFAGHRPKPMEHPSFRGFVVANELSPEAKGWSELPDRQVLWMDRNWEHGTHPIDERIG